ncbi:MAG: hypothetical protein KIG14_02485 [Candidatus Sacchiramonaceae bacterium]|nr:hypothetical protein [Candidatus Saccharimonadaceae bacterium]
MATRQQQYQNIVSAICVTAVSIKRILNGVPRDDYVDALLEVLKVVFNYSPEEIQGLYNSWERQHQQNEGSERFTITVDEQLGLDVFTATFVVTKPEYTSSNLLIDFLENDIDRAKKILDTLTFMDITLKRVLKMLPDPDGSDVIEASWFGFRTQLFVFQELHNTIGSEKLIAALQSCSELKIGDESDFEDDDALDIASSEVSLSILLAPGIYYSVPDKNLSVVTIFEGQLDIEINLKEGTGISAAKDFLLVLDLETAANQLDVLYDIIQDNL